MTTYSVLRYILEPAAVLLHCSAMILSMRHGTYAHPTPCLASEMFRIETFRAPRREHPIRSGIYYRDMKFLLLSYLFLSYYLYAIIIHFLIHPYKRICIILQLLIINVFYKISIPFISLQIRLRLYSIFWIIIYIIDITNTIIYENISFTLLNIIISEWSVFSMKIKL